MTSCWITEFRTFIFSEAGVFTSVSRLDTSLLKLNSV